MSGEAKDRPGRFPWWIYWVGLVIIFAVALWPAAVLYYVSSVADAHHCMVNESGPNPCLVEGVDRGGNLYSLAMLGWYLLGTIPLGVFGLLAWMTTLAGHRAAWRQRKRT